MPQFPIVPQQKSGTMECGLFAAAFMILLSENLPITTPQKSYASLAELRAVAHSPAQFRKRVFEIMAHTIDGNDFLPTRKTIHLEYGTGKCLCRGPHYADMASRYVL